jgi:hypothetical protein
MDAATLELLWARALDGDELDPAEEALLADALDDDPELRDKFLRDHDIETALQWLPRTELGKAAFAANVLHQWTNGQMTPSAPTTRGERLRSGRMGRWLKRWSPTAVAAVFLFAAIGLAWKPGRRDAVASLGTLAAAEQAKWDGEQPKAQLTAEPMRLGSGTVQMLLASGAQVDAQGPAEWRILSGERILVQRGKFSVVVPKRAMGFTVQTPTAIIVDLGTEFDVGVEPDGATNVKVERGAVELATIPQSGVPSERWRLGAGERRRVDRYGKGDGAPIATEPQPKFRGALAIDGHLREFDNEAAFQKAVVDARNAPAKTPPAMQLAETKRMQPVATPDLVAKDAEVAAPKAPPPVDDEPRPPAVETVGVFNCNGRTIEFTTIEEFDDIYREFTREADNFKQLEEMQKQMQKQFEQRMGAAFPNGFRQFGFVNNLLAGSIKWDDKRWEFSDRRSLDRARQQLRRHLDTAKAKPKAKANPNPKTKPAVEKSADKKAASKHWKKFDWNTNVADACKKAAGEPGPDDDKPVFVFRVLGDLNGFL